MIKILDCDENGCTIEINGNAELLAKQVAALLKSLSRDYPYIIDRILDYMPDNIIHENQHKQ